MSDIDTSLTQNVNTKEEAEYLIGKADRRDEDSIKENPDGSYTVELEPDAGDTTKRSVLNTMSKDRFRLLEKVEGNTGLWKAGPMLNVLFNLTGGESKQQRLEAISEDILSGSGDIDDMRYAINQIAEFQA